MNEQSKSETRSRKPAVIVALVLVGIAVAFGVSRNLEKPITSPFPKKTVVQVRMKSADAGNEDIRYTTTWPDGRTPMNQRIELKNGETVYQTFTPQGSKSVVKEYFPLPLKDGKPQVQLNEDGTAVFPSSQPFEFNVAGRQLKSVLVFSEDGKEVVSSELYRPDGTREVVGKRLPDGAFQNLVFHKDGLTLSVSQLFARNGDLVTEQQFAEGGSRLIASSQREADGNLHSKSFREDGTLASIGILKKHEQLIDFFRADGVTRTMTVTSNSYSTTVVYFREDGEAVLQRVFASDGDMTVTELVPGSGRFGPLGTVEKSVASRNKQSWNYIPADTAKGTPARYVLKELEVVDASGNPVRKFIFDETTGAVSRIWMYNGGKNTHDRVYNPDGTLKEVGWLGSDEYSKEYNSKHAKDADRQPGAPVEAGDLELIKKHGTFSDFEDPRPLLAKVDAQPVQHWGDHY
ncbi:MAG: hypothetical protein IT343_21615 [Candidatus Melainabacteria bacterium]|nr:hypothetical protein [Candidatus Melainabacteria bacterium]